MVAKVMRLRCAGYGAKATAVDGLKGAGVILSGTVLSVLVATWMRRQSVDPVYTQALMANGWLLSFVVSMRYTTLKGWPGRTQAIFIGVLSMLIVLLTLGADLDQQPVRNGGRATRSSLPAYTTVWFGGCRA